MEAQEEVVQFIYESTTQTPAQIKAALASRGMDVKDVETTTFATEPKTEEVPAEPAAEDGSGAEPTEDGTIPETPAAEAQPEDGSAGDAEPEEATAVQDDGQQPGKPGGKESRNARYKRRAAEATSFGEQQAALRKAAEDEVAELKRQLAEKPKEVPAPAAPVEPEPQFEDFANEKDQVAAYTKAMAVHTYKSLEQERKAADQAAAAAKPKPAVDPAPAAPAQPAPNPAIAERWKNIQLAAEERGIDDIDKLVNDAVTRDKAEAITPVVAQLVAGFNAEGQPFLEEAPELVVAYLATHPEEAKKILAGSVIPAGASQGQQGAIIGRTLVALTKIETRELARFAAPSAPTTPKARAAAAPPAPVPVAQAPTAAKPDQAKKPIPFTPVNGRSTSAPLNWSDKDRLRNMDPDEFRKMRGQ